VAVDLVLVVRAPAPVCRMAGGRPGWSGQGGYVADFNCAAGKDERGERACYTSCRARFSRRGYLEDCL